jgi:glutamate decarboxylase
VAPSVAYSLARDELILDGNSRQNLATFCATWMEPEVRQLMADSTVVFLIYGYIAILLT